MTLEKLLWLTKLILFFSLMTSHSLASDQNDHISKGCSRLPEYNLGDFHFKISSSNPRVQDLFNQGIILAYGFNHAEAERRFQEALKLEPSCAMCMWGVAYVLGPNINAPMSEESAAKALTASRRALTLRNYATPKEKDYILAISQRYSLDSIGDRKALDQAYADAMKSVSEKYPNDPNAATLYAEAVMDTMPWNYWTPDRQPKEEIQKVIETLQQVIANHPKHIGALHFLIHIVESVRPKIAEKAADQLIDLVPDAGHLQHMPSHIYIRLGRYHEGSIANQKALAADQRYLANCPVNGFYEMMYTPHNYDFLIATAALEGRKELAIKTAYDLRTYIEPHMQHANQMYDLQQFWANPYWALARFREWENILKEPEPPSHLEYARALWHHARAMAYINLKSPIKATQEISSVMELSASLASKGAIIMGLNPAHKILEIGIEEAKGQLQASLRNYETAVGHLKKAIKLQDQLIYIEPPAYYQSVRLSLGHVYLKMERLQDAIKIFQEDLEIFPENGWAISGLFEGFKRQGFVMMALYAYNKLEDAWKYADQGVLSQRMKELETEPKKPYNLY